LSGIVPRGMNILSFRDNI